MPDSTIQNEQIIQADKDTSVETTSLTDTQKEELGAALADLISNAFVNGGDPFQGFVGLTQQLKAKQDELDIMASDSLPSAILSDYLSDVLLPNSNGDLISNIASNPNVQQVVDNIYNRLNIPLDKVVYSLLKNGIVIAKFQQFSVKSVAKQVVQKAAKESAMTHADNEMTSETGNNKLVQINNRIVSMPANEQTYIRQPGTILPNITIVPDTYTVFPILQYEKCVGYLEITKERSFFDTFNWETEQVSYKDVVIHPVTDYCYVTFGVRTSSKPVQLTILNEDGTQTTYDIATGCSMLENAYTAWKTLSILQDSIVLASLIKNAQIMLVEVEGGTATKQQVEAAKLKLRSLFEGQISMGQNGMKSYLNPQSKPAYIYSFTQNGVGKITANLVGGEYNPGQLYYLTPFVNQFFAAMNAPKQRYGFTEGAGGLDGGGAVEQYTERYKSKVQELKRLLGKFIERCINNVLYSKGLTNLVDEFSSKVHGAYNEASNQEVQLLTSKLSLFTSILEFSGVEDPDKLRKVKSLMIKELVSSPDLVSAIDEMMSDDTGPESQNPESQTPQTDEPLLDTQLTEGSSDQLGLDDTDVELPDTDTTQDSTDIELPEMGDINEE